MSSSTELANSLIERGVNGEHSVKERINNYSTYKATKIVKNATKKIALGFKNTSNKLFNAYIKNVKSMIDCPQVLLDSRKMLDCYNFYIDEYKILVEEIDEYEEHMVSGNLIRALLGYDRRDYE